MNEEISIKLVASFSGIKFIPLSLPFAVSYNSVNPKLLLKQDELECNVLFGGKTISYVEILDVDIYLSPKIHNICIFRANSIITFVGNAANELELHKALNYFDRKNVQLRTNARNFLSGMNSLYKLRNQK